MKKTILSITLALAIISITKLLTNASKENTNQYEITLKICSQIDESLSREIPGLKTSGWGGQINEKTVVYRAFDISREIDLTTGRELITKISEAYIDAFNSNKKFMTNFHEEFTNKNLKLTLFFDEPEKVNNNLESIHIISLVNGTIQYVGDNPDDKYIDPRDNSFSYRTKVLYEETYEDAIRHASRA